jgi:diguanylate cyclase (GGDEF)-like protein
MKHPARDLAGGDLCLPFEIPKFIAEFWKACPSASAWWMQRKKSSSGTTAPSALRSGRTWRYWGIPGSTASCRNAIKPAAASVQCPLTAVLHEGKTVEAGFFIQHKAGHRVPVHARTIPLRDGQGSIIGALQTLEEPPASDDPDPNEETMKVGGFLDDVTGLANRAMMHSHMREALGTFDELHIPFGVICIEATELSQFRTRYGPDATISMLRVLARTLRNTVWPSDFVGRWNEDQFLVILNGCSETALQAVSERMRKMAAGASIEWWGEEISIAVSICRASAQAGDTAEALLERALQAAAVNRPAPRSQAAAPATDLATS